MNDNRDDYWEQRVKKHLDRVCAAVYVCPVCGSTLEGRNIKPRERKCLDYTSPEGLPYFLCCGVPMGIVEGDLK